MDPCFKSQQSHRHFTLHLKLIEVETFASPSSLELIRRFPAFAGPSGLEYLEFGLLWVLYFSQI